MIRARTTARMVLGTLLGAACSTTSQSECEEERDALPNFVAVDFYDMGDIFEVVDTLNGL